MTATELVSVLPDSTCAACCAEPGAVLHEFTPPAPWEFLDELPRAGWTIAITYRLCSDCAQDHPERIAATVEEKLRRVALERRAERWRKRP